MKAIKGIVLGLFGIAGVAASVFGLKVPFAEAFAKEYWRAGLAALLTIFLMIPAAIALLLYLVDANRFKTEIIHIVKTQTQRDLVLEGDLKVTFFPKLGLDSGKASLSQRNSAKEFASIGNARFYIAWLPLFKKQLVLERVEIDGMRVNVTRFKDGTTNYDDLLIRNQALVPATFDIEGVSITNSSINWQDEIKWKRIALQDVQIKTGRLADTVPSNISASFHLNSEKLHTDSGITLRSRLYFDRTAGHYELANVEGSLQGTVAGFSNLNLHFSGSLDSNASKERLLAENISISGAGNHGQRGIEAKLALSKLLLEKGSLSGNQLSINSVLSQFGDKWKISLQAPAIAVTDQILRADELNADFDFKGEERILQGRLSSHAALHLGGAPRLRLDGAALDLVAAHPALSGRLAATSVASLIVDFAEGNARLDLKAKVDGNMIDGFLALNDFSHPSYNFDLNADQLDLDRYISADWIKRYQNDMVQLDFSSIRGLYLNGSLHADALRAAQIKMDKLDAGINIEHNILTIAPLSAEFYGGALNGSLTVNVKEVPKITFKQSLRGIQVDQLLADAGSAGKLSGKGDIDVHVSAEGGSIGALRKSLSGEATLGLANGTLAGMDFRSALLEGKEDVAMKKEARFHEAKPGETTEFTGLITTFPIKDGASQDGRFEMKSPLFHIAGEGGFALDTGNVAYRLAATVSPTLNRRSAGELAELRGTTIPVQASGNWAAPSMALDFAAATGGLAEKRVAARAASEQALAYALKKQAVASMAATTKPEGKATKSSKP